MQVCENNLEFTNTPHTPMKRDGVLFITQRRQVINTICLCLEAFQLRFNFQATSDLRENPLVTVLGSHAAMTCQIVVGLIQS